jgi:RNA polymerase sigma-70 factor (ECF subfamily)
MLPDAASAVPRKAATEISAGVLCKLRERIVGYAASRMQRDAAEDLAQEVLILLHEKYAHLERIEDLFPVALKILRFKMLARCRKLARRGEYSQSRIDDMALADDTMDPLLAAERDEMRCRLMTAISSLGERCRKLFALKLDGKNFVEIQEILGAESINTVYGWDFRCRKQLLERLGGSWEGAER